MKASVIVPTYNMAQHLEWTLGFLAEQTLGDDQELEVVIIDDGSSDDTQQVLSRYAERLPLRRIFRPRDADSCRGRARNLGIEAASGELCVFLDSGVIVEPSFVRHALSRFERAPRMAILHQTLGLYATELDHDRSTLTPSTLAETFAELARHPSWLDIRDGLIASVDGELGRLPAAWALGWTCAMSVPRESALAVAGFDDTFAGWGAEDLDFSYRLACAGIGFAASSDALCVHIPHGSSEIGPAKHAEHLANKRKMHERRYDFETESVLLLGSISGNTFPERVERLVALELVPRHDEGLLELVRPHLDGSLVVVGGLDEALLRALQPSSVLVPTRRQLADAKRASPGSNVVRSLGCATSFADRELDVALITDLVHFYPPELQIAQLRECKRIARRCLLACVQKQYHSARNAKYRGHEGWLPTSTQSLSELAMSVGQRLVQLSANDSSALFELTPASA